MPYSRAEIEADTAACLPWHLGRFATLQDVPSPHLALNLGIDLHPLFDSGQAPRLTDEELMPLVKLTYSDQCAFDFARYLAGRYVWFSEPMPDILRSWAYLVVTGKVQRPTRPGRPRDRGLPLRLAMLSAVHLVHHRWGIPLSANRETLKDEPPLNACQVVADVMTRGGQRMTRQNLEALLYDAAPKYAETRAIFEALGLPAIIAASPQANPPN